MSREDVRRMVAYPAPTYVVGIDETREQACIVSVNEPRTRGLGGVSMQYPLNCRNLELLWEEVQAFWGASRLAPVNSRFIP